MAGAELLSLLLVLSVRESVLALCGGRTVGVDASILLYRYLLRAPGAAAALLNGDPSLAVAAFKEVLNWMHKLPISWIFVFDGSCEGKAELSRRRERKRNEAYTTFMTDKFDAKAAAKAATRTPELEFTLVNACLECGQAFLVAPEEADTQLAAMAHDGRVYAVLSEDADLLVMGVQRLLCKMSLQTTCWHFYDLASADWDLVRKQMEGAGQQQTKVAITYLCQDEIGLPLFCALKGCDYDPRGVQNVGTVAAAEIAAHIYFIVHELHRLYALHIHITMCTYMSFQCIELLFHITT